MNSTTNRLCIAVIILVLWGANTAEAVPNILLSMSPIIAARDVTPDPFSFAPKFNVSKWTYIKSDPITVTGINRVLPVYTRSNNTCRYSIDNGPYYPPLNTPPHPFVLPSVSDGQTVTVELLSSWSNGASESCTVTIGETSGTFTVTTLIPPPVKTCASGPQTVEWKGRTWQRCDNGWDYADPIKASKYCDDLNLGGYYDWRLPYDFELRSLIVCDNGNPAPDPWKGCGYDREGNAYGPFTAPTIDPVFQAEPTPYWSIFVYHLFHEYIRQDFATGVEIYNGPYNAGKIRCVRGEVIR